MKLVNARLKPNKPFYLLMLVVLCAGLLAACGGDSPQADTSKLEVVTASSQATVTTAATTEAATTAVAAATTNAATTNAATTNAATTSAVTTRPVTTNAATTSAATTNAATTAPATTKAAATTAAAAKATTPAIKPGVLLEPMTWEAQTWNNCAPVSAEMALSYYGVKLTQQQCAKALKPNDSDKHVRPEELVAFIQKQGFKTLMRENGTLNTLRALLSAGVPVITQQWLHDGDDIGHYRVARGYDLSNNTFIYNDSMDRHDKTLVPADLQDKLWKGYDRRFFPVYTAKQEATVLAILGEDATDDSNLSRALSAAQKYSQANPKDIDGWRNLGYLNYAAGDCKAAINVWEQQLTKMLKPSDNGPYNRFLWYQLWPVECYNKLGNYQQVLKMLPNEIEKTKAYAEARYEYAVALSNTGKKDDAVAQLKKAVLDDPNYEPTYTLMKKLGVPVS